MQNVNLLNMTTAEKLVALAKAINDIYDTPIFPNPRGEWVSNESYNKYDIVVYNNKTYWSVYDGAQSGQQPDTSPNYWVIYIDPVNGKNGTNGTDGTDGDDGKAATITVGTTETVESDQPAEVTNVGSENAAVLNFKIPKGEAAHGYTHIINFFVISHYEESVSFNGQLIFSNDNPNAYTSIDDIGEALYAAGYRQDLSHSPICYGSAKSSLSGETKDYLVSGCYGFQNNSGIWLNITYPETTAITLSEATKSTGQRIVDYVIDGNITLGSSTSTSYVHQINFKTSGVTGQSVGFDGCIFIFNEEPNPYTDFASIGKELVRQGFNGVTSFCNCYGIVSDRSDGSTTILKTATSAGGFDTGIYINCIEPSREIAQLDSYIAAVSQVIKDTVSKI